MALNQPNEDLFEGTRMSFGEHLEELRGVLVRALFGVAIGFAIGLLVGNQVVRFLQLPLTRAIQEYNVDIAKEKIELNNHGILPPDVAPLLDKGELIPQEFKIEPRELFNVLSDNLPEEVAALAYIPYRFSRSQLIDDEIPVICAQFEAAGRAKDNDEIKALWNELSESDLEIVSRLSTVSEISSKDRIAFIGVLNRLIEHPEIHQTPSIQPRIEGNTAYTAYQEQLSESHDEDLSRRLNRMLVSEIFAGSIEPPVIKLVDLPVWKSSVVRTQALNAQEVFMIWLKASFITGFIIASPWVFYQLWVFVGAGLFPHERHYVHLYLPMSIILFFGGAALAFFGVFQHVLKFLFKFNAIMGIDPEPRIGEWLSFVMFMPLGFGIAFQLPLVMMFLNRIGIFSTEAYLEKWRIAILVIAVLSMVFTPADPISMIMLGGPLILLYFGGIGLCKWMPRGRNPFSEAYDPS